VLAAAVPGLRDRMLQEIIRRSWGRIVGPEFAHRSQPGGLNMGALDVIVDNSPSLQEMTLRSSELLAAVQACHGRSVSSLRFRLGIVSPTPGPAVARRGRSEPTRLAPEEADRIDRAVAPVADPALAGSLRQLLTKDALNRRPRGRDCRPDAAPDRKES
jgi:hypothetical protein